MATNFLTGGGLSHLWDRIKSLTNSKMDVDGSNAESSVSMPATDTLSITSDVMDDSWVDAEVGFSLSDDLEYDTANVNLTRQSSATGAATIAVTPKAIDTIVHNMNPMFPSEIPTRHFGFRLPQKVGATAWQVGTRYVGKMSGVFIDQDISNDEGIAFIGSYEEKSLEYGIGKLHSVYSEVEDQFEPLIGDALPYDFFSASLVIYGNAIHMLGGSVTRDYDGEAIDNRRKHYRLEFKNNTWWYIEMSTLPYDFSYGSAVVLNGEIHIIGGNISPDNKKHYKWNGTEWVSVSTLPYEFTQSIALVYNNEIHILGSGYLSSTKTKHYKWNGSTWVSVSTLPYPFYFGCAVVYNDEIHIISGGESADRSKHYKWNGSTWTSVSTLPFLYWEYGSGAVVYNNEIHVLGAYTAGTGSGSYGLNYHYKFDGNKWTKCSDIFYVPDRGSAIVYNNKIHILGGINNDHYNPFYQGDQPGTDIFCYKSNAINYKYDLLPYKFIKGSSVVYNNELHILGAQNTIDNNMRKHYKFSNGEWISVSTLPIDFSGYALILNNEIHILGGQLSMTSHYKWNGTEWTSVSTLPYSFYDGAAVVLNNEIHILGGSKNISGPIHYKWDGSEWVQVSMLPYSFYKGSAIVYNNEIHIFGGGDSANRSKHYKWNGEEWISVSTLPFRLIDGFVEVINGIIHIYRLYYHYKWDGTRWVSLLELPYQVSASTMSATVIKLNKFYAKQRVANMVSDSITFYDDINNQMLKSYLNASSKSETDIENVYKVDDLKLGDLNWDFYTSLSSALDVPTPLYPTYGYKGDNQNYRVDRIFDNYETDDSGESEILCTKTNLANSNSPWIYFIKFRFSILSKVAPAANANVYGGNYLWISLFGYNPEVDDNSYDTIPGFYKEFTVYVKNRLKNPTNKKTTLLSEMTNGRKLIGAKADQPNNAIIIGDNNVAKSQGQIILGQYADPKEDDAFVVGNGSGPDFLSNLFSVDTRGNFRTNGAMIWAQGELRGVLIANSPYWFDMEEGASYIFFFSAKNISGNSFRGIHVQFVANSWDPRDSGASTTAAGNGVGYNCQLGAAGTVGFSWAWVRKPYIHTDPGTGATYTRYHLCVGIGSCATSINCRFSIIKVMGSMEDFPK